MATREVESGLVAFVGAVIMLAPLTTLTTLTWWQALLVVFGTLAITVMAVVTTADPRMPWGFQLLSGIVVTGSGVWLFVNAIEQDWPLWCLPVGGWITLVGAGCLIALFNV